MKLSNNNKNYRSNCKRNGRVVLLIALISLFLSLGPAGTWLVAHENSREMMKTDHVINLVVAAYEQKAYPESAWPDD